MITFTLTIIISLMGLIGLAIGYWLGYRTGYVDGTEDTQGVQDEWASLKAEKGTAGFPSGPMVDGYMSRVEREAWRQSWDSQTAPSNGRDHTA